MSISTKKHDYLSFCCCLVQQANKNEKSLTVLNRSFITTFQPRCHLHNKRFPPRQFSSAARLFLMFVHTQFLQPAIHSALCSSWAHLHWKGWSLPSNTGCCPHSLRSSQGFSSPSSEPMYEKTSTQTILVHTLRNTVKSLQNSSCSAQTEAGGVQTLNTHVWCAEKTHPKQGVEDPAEQVTIPAALCTEMFHCN